MIRVTSAEVLHQLKEVNTYIELPGRKEKMGNMMNLVLEMTSALKSTCKLRVLSAKAASGRQPLCCKMLVCPKILVY